VVKINKFQDRIRCEAQVKNFVSHTRCMVNKIFHTATKQMM